MRLRGSILIDGVPSDAIRLPSCEPPSASFRRRLSCSPTASRRTSPSARPDATQPEILEAATTAHIAAEILEFPHGFRNPGRRARHHSFRRAEAAHCDRPRRHTQPPILILDDALASVDTYTEERILSGLREVMRGRTTIFISHRISTARYADRIAVLVAGRIAELGTPRRTHRPQRLLHRAGRKAATRRRTRRHYLMRTTVSPISVLYWSDGHADTHNPDVQCFFLLDVWQVRIAAQSQSNRAPTRASPELRCPAATEDRPLPDIIAMMRDVEANQRKAETVEKDYLYHSVVTEAEGRRARASEEDGGNRVRPLLGERSSGAADGEEGWQGT